ncbi:MAG: hypothetical protein ACRCU5_13975 [Rhizobiaceae bacterium]
MSVFYYLDTVGRFHKLDFDSASAVSNIASIEARISARAGSSTSSGNVKLAASQTVCRETGLPDSKTVTKARNTPFWKAALLAMTLKISSFWSMLIGEFLSRVRLRESSRANKGKTDE